MKGIRSNYLLVAIFTVFLAGCLRDSPEAIAVKFAAKPSYEMLATSEKAILTSAEFSEVFSDPNPPNPTDEFYKLDKFLLDLVTYKAKKVTKVNEKTVVLVEWTYPTFITDLYGYKTWDDDNKELKEKAINFTNSIESADFNPEDISYSTREMDISVVEDGVFVDAKSIKAELEIAKKTKPLLEELNKIADRYNSIFDMIKLNADRHITFEEYAISLSQKFPDTIPEILKAKKLLAEVRAIDPAYKVRFNQESFFEDAEKVLSIRNSSKK